MPKTKGRDGITIRNGYYRISYIHAQGRRKREKTSAQTLTQARDLRAARMVEAEKCRMLGIVPTTKDSFEEWAPRYLAHQKARLTPRAYERTRGVVEKHLVPKFGHLRLADIRRIDVERYITARSAEQRQSKKKGMAARPVSAHTITKEFCITVTALLSTATASRRSASTRAM